MARIVVTGAAGFLGSHVTEFYARNEDHVVVGVDNLSRSTLLKKGKIKCDQNWNYLKSQYPTIQLIKKDVCEKSFFANTEGADAIIHCAGQTAVTTSITNPEQDFRNNAYSTLKVLEAARKNDVKTVIFCSTNKIYGSNINKIPIKELEKRYEFDDTFDGLRGVDENYPVGNCSHSPYGCSKLAADLYCQEYGQLYGIKTGVFRLSCLYGTRQMPFSDQGWLAWFIKAFLYKKPLTIYGDGKQLRDVLHASDVVSAFDKFLFNTKESNVFNLGGGYENTISLLELIGIIETISGEKVNYTFGDWRQSDQKVYVSDINKAQRVLNWKPEVDKLKGVTELFNWFRSEKNKQY